MNRKKLALLIALLAGFLIRGTAVRADMPAQNFYWANVDAIGNAANVFPAGESAAFKTELANALVAGAQPKKGLDPSYKNVQERSFFAAFENLIKPHVRKGELKKVRGFLLAVSGGKWIQGLLKARNGGDFVTVLDLVTGHDGQYAFRVSNKAVNPGNWQGTTFDHPLGLSAK